MGTKNERTASHCRSFPYKESQRMNKHVMTGRPWFDFSGDLKIGERKTGQKRVPPISRCLRSLEKTRKRIRGVLPLVGDNT